MSQPKWIAGSWLVLALGTLCGGCSAKVDTGGHAANEHTAPAPADHPERGPHQGRLIELGREEYHAELLHDDASHRVTIYLLDAAARRPTAVSEPEVLVNLVVEGTPRQFKLPAAPQPGDPSGSSSRFEFVSEALCQALDQATTTGRLSATIAGRPYSGDLAHAAHDHDHDHAADRK